MSNYHAWTFGIGTVVMIGVVLYWLYKLRQTKKLRDAEIADFHRRYRINYLGYERHIYIAL